MATIKTNYAGSQSWVGYKEEATFGTATDDGGDFIIFDIVGNDAPGFSPEQYQDDGMRNQEKNIADVNDFYKTEANLFQRYTIPEAHARCSDLKHMLYAVCQTVSEAAGDPYLATYSMAGSTVPDFSSNAGYFFTLLIKSPMASFSQKLTSCILETLTINASPDNGGRVTFTGDVITGRGYTNTSNPSGTNAHSTTGFISKFASSSGCTIGGSDMVWYGAQFQIKNVVDYVGDVAGGNGYAENYAIVSQHVTGNITVKYDSATDTFLSEDKGTSLGAVTVDCGVNTADPFLGFACQDSILTDVQTDRGGTDSIQKLNLTFDFRNDYSNTQYVTFTCADGVDATW